MTRRLAMMFFLAVALPSQGAFAAGTLNLDGVTVEKPRTDAPKADPLAADSHATGTLLSPNGDDSYQRICDAFGEGFAFSPATNVCVKVGGYVKAGMTSARH